MSTMRALLWKEWRQVRLETLLLAGFGIAFAAYCGIESAAGNERYDSVALVGLACFLLPGAALVLGATTTAGDRALSFAAARPASSTARVVTRIGMRIAALVVIVASGALALMLAFGSQLGVSFAEWLPERHEGAILVILGGWLLCCFASAALASAYASRPLAAALGGAAIVAALTATGAWLFGSLADDAMRLGIALGALSLALLAAAARATAQRRSDAPLGAHAAGRVIAAGLLAPALLLGAWAAIAPAIVRHHVESVRLECEAMMPELATISVRHPAQEANSAALALERAADPLGIDMVPRARGGLGNADRRPNVAAIEGQHDLWQWLQRELATPSGATSHPPEPAARLLADGAAGLEEVRAILLTGELPRWESGDPARAESPIPNLLGHIHLNRRLLADALANGASGIRDEAARSLEASLRLSESVMLRPETISQFVGIAMAKQFATALRKIPSMPQDLAARLDASRVCAGFAEGILADAATHLGWAEHGGDFSFMARRRDSRLAGWITNPLDAWACAASARDEVELARLLRDPARLGVPVAPGSRSGFGWSGDVGARRLDQVLVQFELTRKVAQIRRLRAADSTDPWPASVPGIEESACRDLRWKYSGGETFSLVPEGAALDWLGLGNDDPAMSYVSP